MDANRIVATPPEPVLAQPLRSCATNRDRRIGELRLPIAGPYHPRARLYLYPDGRLVWLVRLWEYDRAVPHLISTETLREFARANRLHVVRAEVDALVERARSRIRP